MSDETPMINALLSGKLGLPKASPVAQGDGKTAEALQVLREFVDGIYGYMETGVWPDNHALRQWAERGRIALAFEDDKNLRDSLRRLPVPTIETVRAQVASSKLSVSPGNAVNLPPGNPKSVESVAAELKAKYEGLAAATEDVAGGWRVDVDVDGDWSLVENGLVLAWLDRGNARRIKEAHNSCVSRLQEQIAYWKSEWNAQAASRDALLARAEEAEAKLKLHTTFLEGPLNIPHFLSPEDLTP